MVKNKHFKYIYLFLAGLFFLIGTLGIILPLLPTVPFYLLTLFFLSRGSKKFHTLFINSKLYKQNVEPFLDKKGMDRKTKIRIITIVTLLMIFGFYFMNFLWGKFIMFTVWILHLYFLIYKVKTIK